MKNPTIWESASRPLFVRSVWLETASAGRGHQRHFILDYEPRQQQRRLKSALSPHSRRKESLQQSVSYDFSEYDDTVNYGAPESPEELFLIGSAKVKLQQQPTPQQIKQQKLGKHYRRPSFTNKRQLNYEHLHRQRYCNDLHELYSRRSSLQDIHSSLSNACSNSDERLAERVLNWLDLAGKTGFLKPNEEIAEMEPIPNQKFTKSRRLHVTANMTNHNQKLQQSSQKVTATTSLQRSAGNRRNSCQQRNTTTTSSSNAAHHKRLDSMNHITIIFNKEGVPVRLNRPARNIDLCALSSSAVTTRRLAGTLASARLYNSADCGGSTMRYTSQTALSSARRRLDGGGGSGGSGCQETGKSALQKFLNEEAGCSSFHDAKKQLHIFMPSLPKKGLLANATAESTDETASALSNTFSELCKV